MTIVDPMMIERLGELPEAGMRMIEDEAAQAFQLGLSEDLARMVWRSLFWRGHHLSIACPVARMVQVLAADLPKPEQDRIATKLAAAQPDIMRSVEAALEVRPGSAGDTTVAARLWGGDALLGAFLSALVDELKSFSAAGVDLG